MFGATWCNPCKQFRPVFDKASEAAEDVPFGIVYVDTLEGVSELDMFKKHSIQSVPTVRLYREGEETSLRERRIFPFLQELAEARA